MLPAVGRVILISGANRGIGLAIAKNLYQAGFSLSLGARDPNSLNNLVNNWDAKRFLVARYDALIKDTHVEWVKSTFEHFGRLDGLVNNAGIYQPFSVTDDEHDESLLDSMWSVNVKAPLSLTRLALPHLKKSGVGRIINVASLAGKVVFGSGVGYSMTKFALVALSQATRQGGWEHGVRCTALCPGYVATDLTRGIDSVPFEEMTSPEDLASIVRTVLSLSNSASIAELVVNCRPDIIA